MLMPPSNCHNFRHKHHRNSPFFFFFLVKNGVTEKHFPPSYDAVVLFCRGRKGWRGGSCFHAHLSWLFVIWETFTFASWDIPVPVLCYLLRMIDFFRMLKRLIYAVAYALDSSEDTSCIMYAFAATNRKLGTFSTCNSNFDKPKYRTAFILLS